ncbi:MAG: ABC transporter permease [Chloroflexi bacterium]|nr:ABC transporter permease [Chloroflexota bacterium]
MKLIQFFIIAVRSLLANKLRSVLTMLGIIIGVGAVITLTAAGAGAQASVTSLFQELGTNVVYVQPTNPEAPGMARFSPVFALPTLTLEDAAALAAIPNVIGVAPTNENFVEVTAGSESVAAIIHGTTPAYQQAFGHSMASGQFLTDNNVSSRARVVVLGGKAAEELFGPSEAVGQRVKIKGQRFTVTGVLEPKGGSFLGFSMDNIVVVPITTYQARLFAQRSASVTEGIQSIAIQLTSAEVKDEVIDEISAILRQRHRLAEDDRDDFMIVTQEQVLGMIQQVTGVFTMFLSLIAGISLLVGGIGIMNIMLVSVTERTREIGIRKAVGAKRRDVLLQFLFEAAMLSLSGGGIGIIGGWLLATLISRIEIGGQRLVAVISPDTVVLAISVSVFIGLVSGMYPAIRASRLNPIDALRYG